MLSRYKYRYLFPPTETTTFPVSNTNIHISLSTYPNTTSACGLEWSLLCISIAAMEAVAYSLLLALVLNKCLA